MTTGHHEGVWYGEVQACEQSVIRLLPTGSFTRGEKESVEEYAARCLANLDERLARLKEARRMHADAKKRKL